MTRQVAVVGGGISGLAAAIALADNDYEVQVFEKDVEANAGQVPGGGKVALTFNGIEALKELRLGGTVSEAGHETRIGAHYTSGGTVLSKTTETEASELITIPATELRDILKTRAEKAGVQVHYDSLIEVESQLPDVDLIVGADGLHSEVRGWAFRRVKPEYSGAMRYWGVTSAADVPNEVAQWFGPATRLVLTPLAGGKVHWEVVRQAVSGGQDDDPKAAAAQAVRGWAAPVAGLIEGTEHVEREDIVFLPSTLNRFTSTKTGTPTLLVGDAAHAMVPTWMQGENQSFEDAATLRVLAEEITSLRELCRRYDEERVGRAQRIQSRSLSMLQFGQGGNPFAAAIRNASVKLTPTIVQEIANDWVWRWPNPRKPR